MNRGNIETRESFVGRNIACWKEHKSRERGSRKQYYDKFIETMRIDKLLRGIVSIGEVGGGAFGGIIEVCKLSAKKKYFIDYIQAELMTLGYIEWPENAFYINAPAESIPLPDKQIDLLFSYNALDHGWNIYQAIKECHRVSKRCVFAFDCRGDSEREVRHRAAMHDIDHFQLLKFKDMKLFLETFNHRVILDIAETKAKFPIIAAELINE